MLIYYIINKWVKLTLYRLVSVLFELMHMICGLRLFLASVLVTLLLAYLDHLLLNYHQASPLDLIPFSGTCVSHLQSSCKQINNTFITTHFYTFFLTNNIFLFISFPFKSVFKNKREKHYFVCRNCEIKSLSH